MKYSTQSAGIQTTACCICAADCKLLKLSLPIAHCLLQKLDAECDPTCDGCHWLLTTVGHVHRSQW